MKRTLLLLIPLFLFLRLTALGPAYLGVYLEDLAEYELRANRISEGVKIEDVVPNSPAEQAGLIINDIILAIDDEPIINSIKVRSIIRTKQPGDSIIISYLSDKKKKVMSVTLGEREDKLIPEINFFETKTKHLGLKLQSLTDQLKQYFKVEYGVLVAEVIKDTPAHKAGVKAGDILQKAADKQIETVGALREVIKDKRAGETVEVLLIRDGKRLTLQLGIEETDSLFSIDLNNEIIILGQDRVIDISGLNRWFQSVMPDSTRGELESQLQKLQDELDQIRKRLMSR